MIADRFFGRYPGRGGFCRPGTKGGRCAAWLAALATALMAAGTAAEDWPTYQHDAARSGVTTEQLAFPLAEGWVFRPRYAPQPAWGDPKDKPVEGILELRRNHFDDAFQVAAAGGRVFFGSSSENKLFCLDAATGAICWKQRLGGPIRLAPTYADGRVYVGCDDGYAYCFEAGTGRLVWRFHAAPEDRRVLGHGRMISLWPLRGGVLIDGGVAYLAAGIFPAEGIFLYALDAKTGRELWRNDTCGEDPRSGISPQGYLLASATTLYAPLGRVSPAAFDRQTGRLKYHTYFGKTVGGSYALLVGEHVYTGTEELVAYQGETRDRFATFPGRKIVVAGEAAYLATGTELLALDRLKYPAASRRLASLRTQRQQLLEVPAARRTEPQRRQLETLTAQLQKAQEEAAALTLWRVPSAHCESLILAGRTLLAGGPGEVIALDAVSGQGVWRAKVEGTAKGLAVAAGRLLVSTDRGLIYSFGPAGISPAGIIREAVASEEKLSPTAALFQRAARAILQQAGLRRGFCLVLGTETGELARELARQSELTIYCVTPDQSKAARVAEMLDQAGLYGARASVEVWPLDRVPYADYFANLIVSETAVLGGPLPPAEEAFRMLKPEGGVLLLGQPVLDGLPAAAQAQALAPEALRGWAAKHRDLQHANVVQREGLWLALRRGPIPGGGQWTHLYGNPGNTGCGNDQALRCPLGVLWFGQPGPAAMVNRHARAAGPLSVAGRLFVQGENVVMAFDAYNGLKLWEQPIAGALRENASHDGSNLAADDASVFVATGSHCLRLDAATGKRLADYELPGPDSAGRRWGIVACAEGLLFGSRSPKPTISQAVFAIDLSTGKPRWVYQGKSIPHNTIAVAGGRVLLIDAAEEGAGTTAAGSPAKGSAKPAGELRSVVALDARTGKVLWKIALDVSQCGGSNLALMSDGRYGVIFGVYLDGHYWQRFFAGEFASRRVVVLDAQDGKLLWSKPVGYRVRPVLIGDTLHTEPWAFDVRTGEPLRRTHPVTGLADLWQFARPGHHCGLPIGTANALFFRSWCLGYYDLLRDAGTAHFGAQRPGCWVNFIPAGGLLLMPEASAGCMCAFPNMCSIALHPVTHDKAFTYYSAPGPLLPVKRLGLNFGAAGDRKDASGELWLGFPRPSGSLVLALPVSVAFLPQGGYVQRNSAYTAVQGDPRGWLFASAARGIRQCILPVVGPGDGAASYRLRLGFADPDNTQPGRRVFDVKVQGQTVLKDLDVVREAGGRDRALWREVAGVVVRDQLTVEFIPKSPNPAPEEAPILQAIEIQRQEVLELGCLVPSLTLSSLEPKHEAAVELSNQRAVPFEGTLEVAGPAGITLRAGSTAVRLEPNGRLRIPLVAAVAGQPALGEHTYRVRLVAKDGSLALDRAGKMEYLGRRGRVVLPPVEDASVSLRYPTQNKATATELIVDGGNQKMGDTDHALAYLKFRLALPGKPVAARLRLYNAGNPSGSAGRVCLAEGPWSESGVTYANRPRVGMVLATLGAVAERQMVERPIPVQHLAGSELSLVIEPTSTDGVDYFSREGQKPPELVVEYALP